jgi:predicted Kef-type K+ transport protein
MTWDHWKGDAMNQDASNPTAADERPRLIIIGLIVWIILQVPRLIAIPLIQGVLDDTESDAWMFPAILDIAVAVAAPFLAVALWRARGLWVWVTATVPEH